MKTGWNVDETAVLDGGGTASNEAEEFASVDSDWIGTATEEGNLISTWNYCGVALLKSDEHSESDSF